MASGRRTGGRSHGAARQNAKRRAPARAADTAAGPSRSGSVAIVGRPNVGKSTLLNAALELPLAIVSPRPQTTRDPLLGIVHRGAAEIAFVDTPGLHRPKDALGRVMNRTAREAAEAADVVVFMTDVSPRASGAPAPHPGDVALLQDIGGDRKTLLVVNKVDRLKDKGVLLPLLDAYQKLRTFEAIVPISAARDSGVERVLDEIAPLLPAGAWRFGADDITDRPVRYFASEYIREQVLLATEAEVPYATAVSIEQFVEPAGGGAVHIEATIHVEREGQKGILIGAGGEMLKRIGTRARQRIEELTGRKVNLKLWVRVTPAWRESPKQLEELGFEGAKERPAMKRRSS